MFILLTRLGWTANVTAIQRYSIFYNNVIKTQITSLPGPFSWRQTGVAKWSKNKAINHRANGSTIYTQKPETDLLQKSSATGMASLDLWEHKPKDSHLQCHRYQLIYKLPILKESLHTDLKHCIKTKMTTETEETMGELCSRLTLLISQGWVRRETLLWRFSQSL